MRAPTYSPAALGHSVPPWAVRGEGPVFVNCNGRAERFRSEMGSLAANGSGTSRVGGRQAFLSSSVKNSRLILHVIRAVQGIAVRDSPPAGGGAA
ncbi:protein of unknown function [Rhodovastum atsumiense]|nr:protein of unknown function [Rhodovastum atsumiense]